MPSDLFGLSEIADLAGVTRQAVTNWRKRFDDFPKPAQTLQSGPVWNRDEAELWLKQKAGRTHVIIFINLKRGSAFLTPSDPA